MVENYELYYNLDLEVYGGKSEAGMSSRVPAEDGYFHINFFLDGETVVLKAAERRIVNTIDVLDVMGLEFDEDGIISEVIPPEDMPLEMIGWRFFVQSAARTMLKLNSSESFNGLEILLEDGSTVSASGSNAFPENYAQVHGEIRALYAELMEKHGVYQSEPQS